MVLLKSVCESVLEHSFWAPLTEEERLGPFISWAASLTLIAHCTRKVCRTFVRNRIFCSMSMRSHYLQHLGLLECNYLMFFFLCHLNLTNAVHCTSGSFLEGFLRVLLFVLFLLALFGPCSLFGQYCHLFFFMAVFFKEFCQEERKLPPEPYSVKQMKVFWL